ncbi:MAG: OmpA family protein [Paracoccaceae bacterium]
MRFAAIATATAGFLVSVLAAAVVADFAVGVLEETTQRNTKSSLVASGQNWAQVDTDGTLVFVTGMAPDSQKRIQAFDAISSVVSIGRIRETMTVEERIPAIAPNFALEILRSGTDVSLIGLSPNEGQTDTIRQAIANIDGVSLIDMKESTQWDAPDGWHAALAFGAEIMSRVERAKISIIPGEVDLTAVVKSDAEKRLLQRELLAIKPDGVALKIDITAPRPIIAPYTLTLFAAESETTLMCYALTRGGADRIVAAAGRIGALTSPACEIGLGAPTDDWADAAIAGINAVANMGSGSLEIRDSSITLNAVEGFDAGVFNSIVAALQDALPEAYSLKAILPEAKVVAEDEAHPYFHARLSLDGSALLEGVTIDDISKRTLLTYAMAKFGHAAVSDTTNIAQFAPHGWTSRQLVALDVLSLLIEGNIKVTEDTVAVTGTGETTGLYSAILGKLEVGFGADARFTIVVEEIIPEPVAEDVPDPKECEAEISTLLGEKQIIFAPSSAVIDSASVKTINKIVTILHRCDTAVFEIGGHTDSQGREEMNLNLSQSRADAVWDSLLARNMLLGDLSAIGYGETQPIADNDTEDGRQENRRIEFKLIEETTDGQN